jgi:DNA-binding response OmpR family regulator
MHPASRTALLRGEPLDLTSTEYNLLQVLLRQAGRVVTKAELCQEGLGRKLARYDRSIDMHVSHLRRKLGDALDGRSVIQTVRGIGYQLVA